MRKYLVVLVGILISGLAHGQVEFSQRYEQPHDWLNNSYLVIPNEKDGVLIVQADFDGSSKMYPISFTHLNKDLEKTWQDTVSIKQRFFLRGYFHSQQKTYLMLQDNRLSSIKILRIDALNQKVDEFESKKIAELNITEFEVLNNTAIIGGYFEDRPVVFAYDLEADQVRTLQNVYQNQSQLLEVKINKDSVTFNVLASVLDDDKERTIMVNTYDFVGNAIRDYQLITKPQYELVNGVSSSINDIEQVIVGVYGYKTEHTVSGIYVNHVDRTGTQTMKYYNFGELPKFLDYMGEKRSNKVKGKAESMKRAGKEHRYKADVTPQELIEMGDKLVFTGEFFKLYTQDNNGMNAGGLNRWGARSRANDFVDSYQQFRNSSLTPRSNDFTHAYMLVLNQKGELQWDDYMEIDEDIIGSVQELGKFHWMGDKGAYMYYRDTELFIKTLDGSGKNEMVTTELDLLEEGDEIRLEKDASLGSVRWYDNHYLIYGVHHIKPADRSKSVRKVFFINKVSVTGEPTTQQPD